MRRAERNGHDGVSHEADDSQGLEAVGSGVTGAAPEGVAEPRRSARQKLGVAAVFVVSIAALVWLVLRFAW